MRKATWIPLIIIIVGVCLALAGFAYGGGIHGIRGIAIDRGGFHISNTDRGSLVKVDESFTDVTDIVVDVAFLERVVLKEGDGFSVRGQNYENYGGLTVQNDNGTLRVNANREGRWQVLGPADLRRGLNQTETFVEITYPANTELGSVRTNISAGRLVIDGLLCSVLDVINDFGDVDLTGVGSGIMTVNLSAGNAKIRNSEAERLRLSNDFGKTSLDNTTINSLDINISSGDLSANNLNVGDLFVNADFGSARFDRLMLGGRGEIKMSSGAVNISLNMSEDDIFYELSASAGKVTVDEKSGAALGGMWSGGDRRSDISLSVVSDFGAITLRFLK